MTDERVVIYSVGENLTDDGGDVEHLDKRPNDVGFILLPPDRRGRPHTGIVSVCCDDE